MRYVKGFSWLMLFAVLITILGGYTQVERNFSLVMDGEAAGRYTVRSGTVGAALHELGIVLSPEDLVLPATSDELVDDMEVKVFRAVPISLIADGQTRLLRLPSPTVATVLAEGGLTVGVIDRIETNLNSSNHDLFVKVIRVREETVVEDRVVPYGVRRIRDENLDPGAWREIRSGRNGQERLTVKLVLEDGKVVSREVLNTKLVKAPRDRVIAVNRVSRAMVTSRQQAAKGESMVMEATAYTYTGHRTATGIWPQRGIVAVDPKVIPLGSQVFVEGYGYARAMDTGGAIKGLKIDVFMENHQEAVEWGRRAVRVYLP